MACPELVYRKQFMYIEICHQFSINESVWNFSCDVTSGYRWLEDFQTGSLLHQSATPALHREIAGKCSQSFGTPLDSIPWTLNKPGVCLLSTCSIYIAL